MTEAEYNFWAKQAEKARQNSLTNVQAVATKWTGTITAVLGVLATFGLTLGPNMFSDRHLYLGGADLTVLLPIILMVALGLLANAVYRGYLATQSSVRWITWEPEPFQRAYNRQVDDSIKELNESRRFFSYAVIAIAVLIFVRLFSTFIPAPTPFVQITTAKGVYCGTLSEGSSGLATLKTPSGMTITDPAITAITPVKDCYTYTLPPAGAPASDAAGK